MNKYIPYVFALVLSAAIITLVVTGNKGKKRRINPRITLRRQDKIPYGTYAAFKDLPYLFPEAGIYTDRREPGYWDSLSVYDSNQAYIVITPKFFADDIEMKKLQTFVENGNDVFISSRYYSAAADAVFGCTSSSYDLALYSDEDLDDSLNLLLNDPPFQDERRYHYPGKKFSSYFDKIDSTTTDILGYDENGHPNFIHLRAGKGNFFLHMEPLAFSNYFLLHGKNIGYYEKVLSLVNPHVTRLIWDEYYLNKRYDNSSPKRKSWLNVLFTYPALKAALLTAILTLLVYVLIEMRRKQRYIPVLQKPKNETLDFVKTIGRLYFEKGDHKNLSRKMAAYFLDYVRNRYKLATGELGDDFIRNLQFKTGCNEEEIRAIVASIRRLDEAAAVQPVEVTQFYKQLEAFYKKA